MTNDGGPDPEREDAKDRGEEPTVDRWGRQMLGALVGALAGLLCLILGEALGMLSGDRVRYMLWGAVIGGLAGASERLAAAGKGLTKRDEQWLNILVALVGMAIITGVLFALSTALARCLGPALGQ